MSNLLITPVGKGRFKTTQPYKRNGIDVPVGFVFDGASIPRPLWFAFAPHEYLASSVIHDYGYFKAKLFYKTRDYTSAREWFSRADSAFLAALKEDDRRVARLFYNAVRLWRWVKYWRAR